MHVIQSLLFFQSVLIEERFFQQVSLFIFLPNTIRYSTWLLGEI